MDMDEEQKDKVFSEISRLLLENDLPTQSRESILEIVLRLLLDRLEEIEEIDIFQEKVNDMIDDYVEHHFEDSSEESYN